MHFIAIGFIAVLEGLDEEINRTIKLGGPEVDPLIAIDLPFPQLDELFIDHLILSLDILAHAQPHILRFSILNLLEQFHLKKNVIILAYVKLQSKNTLRVHFFSLFLIDNLEFITHEGKVTISMQGYSLVSTSHKSMSVYEKWICVCCFIAVAGVIDSVGNTVGALEKDGMAVEEARVDEVFVYLSVSH